MAQYPAGKPWTPIGRDARSTDHARSWRPDTIGAFHSGVVSLSKVGAGLRLGSLSLLALGLTAAIPISTAAAASSPKPGIGPGGLTSARLCGFVSASEIPGLLGGASPEGSGNPNNYNLGSADCTWATSTGANTSLSVSTNPGIKGCNGAKGKLVHFAGTTGCVPKIQVGMEVGKGKYYLEFSTNGISASPKLTSTMEKVATQVFKDVHA